MELLKLIGQTIVSLVKQVWFFPECVANAIKLRRQKITTGEHEAERLDRIRNPSKYLGKS